VAVERLKQDFARRNPNWEIWRDALAARRQELLIAQAQHDPLARLNTALQNELAVINLSQIDLLPAQTVQVDALFGDEGDDELHGGGRADFLSGGAGNDTAFHSAGDDTVNGDGDTDTYVVEGTAADDEIIVEYVPGTAPRVDVTVRPVGSTTTARVAVNHANIENAEARGLGGNDRVTVNFPRSVMNVRADGGEGNDTLNATASAGDNTLLGGAGDDTLTGGTGADRLEGGAGRDTMYYGPGGDVYDGGADLDRLTVEGTSWDDRFVVSHGTLTRNNVVLTFGGGGFEGLSVLGGQGYDVFISDGSALRTASGLYLVTASTVPGSEPGYAFVGGDHGDTFQAMTSSSTMAGLSTELLGGAGDDIFLVSTRRPVTVTGGTGWNMLTIDGDESANTMRFANPSPTLNTYVTVAGDYSMTVNDMAVLSVDGRGGNDTLDATNLRAAITLRGGAGRDTLTGGAGADYLYGGTDNDRLVGGSGNDRLSGDQGDDDLYGQAGNDTLYGNAGTDWLVGGTENDTLDGGADNAIDYLWGGTGSDAFWVNDYISDLSTAWDEVMDFSAAQFDVRYQGQPLDLSLIL
jgi:Ca2+-binding RTX toxin-like protein